MSRPFADSVADYARAGWPCILPVPVEAKSPPPVGYTGADGADTDPMTLVQWATSHGDWSVALRMPDGVIGIDVDHYAKGGVQKRGGDSLAEHEQMWGPLPPTWRSSARDLPSGIRFYRAPAQRYATKLGQSIEIIQRHHRYAVVAPSWHTAVGAPYRWYGPDGEPCEYPPKVDELPELPPAWVEGLREGATEAGPAAAEPARGARMLAELQQDQRPPCAEVYNATLTALRELDGAESGSRHDITTARVHHLVQLGAAGHPGVGASLLELQARWEALTAAEGRQGEYDRMLLTSARKAVTKVGDRPVDRDPCFAVGVVPVAAPAPADDRPDSSNSYSDGGDYSSIEPPRELHPLEIIGAHPFDPRGGLDQTMAAAVLARTQPLMRFAHDARVWLRRGPEVWETYPDLTEWAVALLADRMPLGDPDVEKGSEAREQADRRKRFMSAGPAGGVARKIKALVSGGAHPSTLRLADLDREPWLLWAGGVGWDLRASREAPVPALIDPSTPHRHSAAVAPAPVPTPRWDRFLEAVWPDPELRAWALRVLAITLTGHSDKALPILVGEKDRGKTQVVVLLMSVLGTYAHAADPRLLGGADKAHASIIYALMGRRLSFIDEGPRGGTAGTERLKQLTGGADLTGNAMNSNPVTWKPTHTLILTCNDEPVLTDPAVRSRVRLIPCEGDVEQVLQARRAIGHLSDAAWRAEAPGVLAMMMREAAAWMADPDSATTAAAPGSYRFRAEEIAAEQDPIVSWLDEETEPHPDGERSRALYEAFVGWCRNGNIAPQRVPTETKWGKELERRGLTVRHTKTGKRRPLRLRHHGGWAMPASPTPQGVTGWGSGDGLVTGSSGNPSPEKPQVNPNVSVSGDGLTGCSPSYTHAHAHTRTHEEQGENNPSTRQPVTQTHPDLRKGDFGNPSPPLEPVTPEGKEADKRGETAGQPPSKTEKARASKIEKREADRAAKIADAAGERIPLPAAADRAGNVVPLNLAQAKTAVRALVAAAGALTVDVETTGYPVGHALYALRTVQLGNENAAVVFDPSDLLQAAVVRQLLAEAPKLHAHSATADLVPLTAAGLCDESAWLRMWDTVLPAKLADPESTGSDPGLKKLSAAVLGQEATAPAADAARDALFKAGKWLKETQADTPIERSGWAQVDSGCMTMIRYAASDVLDTAALPARLPELPAELAERERAVQRITARVAHRGLRIDGEQVDRLHAEHTAAQAKAAERVRAHGIDNPGSGPQVAGALAQLGATLPQTPTGRPSVAEAVLSALRGSQGPVGDLAGAVLDYRHHGTALGLFLEPYRQLVCHGDGRARPTVYTLSADTGRMSCVRPNLQQVPREGGFRSCITADPGHLLISADFSSVEVRVMAALSQDPQLIGMVVEGQQALVFVESGHLTKDEWQRRYDLHSIVAAQAFGPGFTKADRYTAKRGVFGWAYGGGVASLAAQVGVSESVMAAVVDSLALVAPRYVEWAGELRRAVRGGATQMPTYAGRVIHLQQRWPHKAPNFAIQGTARELLVDALLAWDQTRWGGGVVLPVHDEIVAMVPAAEAPEATAALVRCMTTELYGVPIVAEADDPAYAWQDAA
jgi:DNA polymerase I-like protein with 3'-5' exonuclease and polymerase domains